MITVMSEHLANQIAAGEVVERPASVIKELVENSIDASATEIKIWVQEGGITKIKVSDNGVGISREDAKKAFLRHATSKLKHERELKHIRTLGFRGEALSSIASVANVKLITSVDSDEGAISLNVLRGELQDFEQVARARGTDIIVENLFYNTPARLKHLKSVSTEISHIADVVGRLALAYPYISFNLYHDDRELFSTSKNGNLYNVVHTLYGTQVSKHLLNITGEDDDFTVHGLITKPEITRSNRSYLSILFNKRFVRSVPITRAILSAYETLLPTGRYPLGVISIEADPQLVDVNVHPAKLEIRLSKERECCDLITKSIKKVLENSNLLQSYRSTNQFGFGHSNLDRNKDETKPKQQLINLEYSPKPEAPAFDEDVKETDTEKDHIARDIKIPEPNISDTDKLKEPMPFVIPLAQIHATYIIAQANNGFYLLDQHAAHERIYYEKFFTKLHTPMEQRLQDRQMLLIPITLEVTAKDALMIEQHLEYLNNWGMEIDAFGDATFIVRSYPAWFPDDEVKEWIYDVLDQVKEVGEVTQLRDKHAKMMACKAAIKANKHLSQIEMEELLSELSKCKTWLTCPHGRPIFIHFSDYELEKMFKRVM